MHKIKVTRFFLIKFEQKNVIPSISVQNEKKISIKDKINSQDKI